MGTERIKKNLDLTEDDVVGWCRLKILDEKADIRRQGKNWYVHTGGCVITVNASSGTLITAHRE
ncbi:MAG: DUF3781 domain-containing protein [Fretibacterium sp.]|nr:DUF3781 domain-containing protein [Fretibacterium sp.]